MALHLKPDAVETRLCPDLAEMEPASVPAFINDDLRDVFLATKAFNQSVGSKVYDLPAG